VGDRNRKKGVVEGFRVLTLLYYVSELPASAFQRLKELFRVYRAVAALYFWSKRLNLDEGVELALERARQLPSYYRHAFDEDSQVYQFSEVERMRRPRKVILQLPLRSRYEELMPRNRGFLDKTAALFQGAAAGNPEALEEVVKMLHEAGKGETEIALLLAPEKLAEIAAETREREKRLNRAFAEELVSRVRALVREARARGWSVAIVIDPIDSESLRGTELQRTLLKPRRLLRNLARYEGARFKLCRVSGKRCPMCGSWGVEVAHRRHRCPYCNIEWDRDKCATFWLAKRFLDEHFREESSDETYVDIAGWLREHPRGLL
jgi:hypothetical protein